jgi:hypothetical protein
MLNYIISALSGVVVGAVYSFLFLSSFDLGPKASTKFDFKQLLTFIIRFIFIVVAVIALPFYFKINLFWFLISLGVTFWICVLAKLRVR